MNNKEKAELLKQTISFLYSKEGRSISYISRVTGLDRRSLRIKIKQEWELLPPDPSYHLSPSKKKFANKYREFIKSKLDKNVPIGEIAKELHVQRSFLTKQIAVGDEVIRNAIKEYRNREKKCYLDAHDYTSTIQYKDYVSTLNMNDWHLIVGHPNYYVSRYGDVVKYEVSYDEYHLLAKTPNCRSGYIYTAVDDKNLAVHRLVAIYFVPGRTDVKNTVNHIDGNKKNNRWDNLEWCSQSENNKWAYRLGRNPSVAKNDIKEIIVDGKYKFKTITAMAKFLNVSWTQAGRYIRGECKCSRSLEIIRNCID